MAKILVVDDERVVRDLVRAVLVGEGHEVGEARDGLEALEVVEQNGLPDIIVLDLMMPQMDGWRFLEELRSRGLRRHTRVIILSALSDEDTRKRGTAEGAQHVLSKPFDTDALIDAVSDALAQPAEDIAASRERVDELAEMLRTIDEALTN